MSHFFVAVILPEGTPDNEAEAMVEKLLAPYDENIEVEEYDRECYCVGSKAVDRARARVWGSKEDIERLRREFNEKHKDKEWGLRNEIWKTEVWSPRNRVVGWLVADDPMADFPDPDCEDCRGTGTYKSNYNQLSKWDWYVIGGRWDGCIQGNPRDDGEGGFNFGDEHHQLGNNLASVSFILENEIMPFAIVTPDGEWYEKGEMGWWGVVSNEKDCDIYQKKFLDIMEKYKDHTAVGVDCHI